VSFDSEHKITPEKQKSGYKLDGKEITTGGKRGRPRVFRNPEFYPQEKKIEACALYTVIGDLVRVAEKTHVPEKVLRQWKEETWWGDVARKIMVEQNEGLLSTVNRTIDRAVNEMLDRIDKGDYGKPVVVRDSEGNEIVEHTRTPIKARDLAQIFHTLAHEKQLLEGKATTITGSSTTEEKLALLQKHFKAFSLGKVVDGELREIEDKTIGPAEPSTSE